MNVQPLCLSLFALVAQRRIPVFSMYPLFDMARVLLAGRYSIAEAASRGTVLSSVAGVQDEFVVRAALQI